MARLLDTLFSPKKEKIPKREKQPREKRRRRWRIVLLCAALALVALIITLALVLDVSSWGTLKETKLYDLPQTLFIYDADGRRIASIYNQQDRVNTDISQLPQDVKNAFVAAEDERFYSHHGIDVRRVFGAMKANMTSGEYSQGASTISQQLIKLTHLSNEKTLARKAQEAYLAWQLERRYEKDEILEMYLNTVYFGRGAYGIEAASSVYFAKPAKDLTLDEAALLAAILKSPTNYAPHIEPENALARRNLVLDLMVENEMLAPQEAARYRNVPIKIEPDRDLKYDYGYYVDAVLLEATGILDVTLEELYSNGYRIHTVMDRELQSTAEQLCADLNNFPPAAPDGTFAQVAVVAMDPRTGAVSTLVGGREYETALGFNRATQMRRQPGSIIKPFVSFSPALEELNMNAVTFLNDEPTDFNGYKPRNFGDSYNGRVTLRTALANSLNVPAVYLLNEAGVNVGFSYAQRAGLPLVEADRGLATALGGITQGVTPLEICNAYAGFANMGQRMQGYTIERIEHADGTVIYEHEPESTYFLSAETAFMMNDLLYYTADRGTAAIFNTVGTRLAGKTGTVDYMDIGNKDAWATGYNPEIVMTAWMGIDTPAPDRYMSTQVVGGRQPANLIARILTEYYIDRESPDWYTMPVGLTAVDIDMQTTEILGRPIVATANTPAAYRQTTYFRIGSVPTETTTFWDTPRAPADVAVSEDAEGVPIVTFTMPSTYVFYQLYRQVDDGAAVLLATVDGSQGKAAIRDVEAPHAMPSKYYVTPVHKYARPDGSKNVGLPSRPVIHVRSQSQIIIPVLPDDWAPNTPGLPPPSEDEFEDMEPGNDVPRTQIGDDLGGQNQ